MKNSLKKILLYLATLVGVIYFFGPAGADPDLWGHIQFGQEMWRRGGIVRADIYSYTASGSPWINHEWLAELIMSGCFSLGGGGGLIGLRLVIGGLLTIVLVRAALPSGLRGLGFLVVFWFAAPLIAQGFAIRPQIFSYLLAGICLFLVGRAAAGKIRALLFCLPLMALWANLHGGFLVGMFILLIFCLWYSVSTIVGDRRRIQDTGCRMADTGCRMPDGGLSLAGRRLTFVWLVFILAGLATLINPYGWGLWKLLYRSMTESRIYITEWRPLGSGHIFFLRFAVLVLTGLTLCLLSSHRWSVLSILLLVLGAVSFCQMRHSPFAALVAVVCLPSAIDDLLGGLERRFRWHPSASMGRVVWGAAVVLVLCQSWEGCLNLLAEGGKIRVNPYHYPVKAVEFMRQNGIGGNLLAKFDWGEYCLYQLYPACRVAFDGRFETVYSRDLAGAYWAFAIGGEPAIAARLIEDYPATLALLDRTMWGYDYLARVGDWLKIYEDAAAALFARNNPGNQNLIKKWRQGRLIHPAWPAESYFP